LSAGTENKDYRREKTESEGPARKAHREAVFPETRSNLRSESQ